MIPKFHTRHRKMVTPLITWLNLGQTGFSFPSSCLLDYLYICKRDKYGGQHIITLSSKNRTQNN